MERIKEELSDYQINLIQDMYEADIGCGFSPDYESTLEAMYQDEDLADDAEEAADYYMSLVESTKTDKKPMKESVDAYEGELVVSEDGNCCYTSAKKLLADLNAADIWPQEHSLQGIAEDHDTADYWKYYPSVVDYVQRHIFNPWQWESVNHHELIDIASATIDLNSKRVSFVLDVMPDENPDLYEEIQDMVDRGYWVQDDENAFTTPELWYYMNELE